MYGVGAALAGACAVGASPSASPQEDALFVVVELVEPLCQVCSALHPQEYLNDYGDEEAKRIGEELIAKEGEAGLSDSAKRMLARKMAKVNAGEHDVYI